MTDINNQLYKAQLAKLQPWTHWRFTQARKDKTRSQCVEIVDTYITVNPQTDTVNLMDLKDYAEGETRLFTTVLATDFLTLIEQKKVERFTPKA